MTVTDTGMPEVLFEHGLPGFADAHRFALVEVDGSALYVLRSLEEPGLQFVVAPPALFFPDYAPEVDEQDAERLELETADDALLLIVLTLGDSAADATGNLRAPVVVNQRTRRAEQVLLASDAWSLRQPLAA